MKPFADLVHDALYARTRIYTDKNGNYVGQSTDITPWMLLIGRVWGFLVFINIIGEIVFAPIYYAIVSWFCHKYDKQLTKQYPKEWPEMKKKKLFKYRWLFWIWVIFISYNALTGWGQSVDSKVPYTYTQKYVPNN